MTCPLCSAPSCDCPPQLVAIVVETIQAAVLALRPVKIALVAREKEIAARRREAEDLRLIATSAVEERDARDQRIRALESELEVQAETIAAYKDASGLLVGGDPDGVTPALLGAFIQRQDRMIRAWHKVAQKYRGRAAQQEQRAQSLESELSELRKPLGGELGEIEREHTFVQRFVDKLSEVGNAPAHLQIDAINRGGHAHRGILIAEVHRLQSERDALRVELAAAKQALAERGSWMSSAQYEAGLKLMRSHVRERDELKQKLTAFEAEIERLRGELSEAVEATRELSHDAHRAFALEGERDALAVEVAAARKAIEEAQRPIEQADAAVISWLFSDDMEALRNLCQIQQAELAAAKAQIADKDAQIEQLRMPIVGPACELSARLRHAYERTLKGEWGEALALFGASGDALRIAEVLERHGDMIPLTTRLPPVGEGLRVLVYTEGYDFNGQQYFDVRADDLYEPVTEVEQHASHWMLLPRVPLPPVSALPAPGEGRAAAGEEEVRRG